MPQSSLSNPFDELNHDRTLPFGKVCTAWLLSLDPRSRGRSFAKYLCAAMREDADGEEEDLKELIQETGLFQKLDRRCED